MTGKTTVAQTLCTSLLLAMSLQQRQHMYNGSVLTFACQVLASASHVEGATWQNHRRLKKDKNSARALGTLASMGPLIKFGSESLECDCNNKPSRAVKAGT